MKRMTLSQVRDVVLALGPGPKGKSLTVDANYAPPFDDDPNALGVRLYVYDENAPKMDTPLGVPDIVIVTHDIPRKDIDGIFISVNETVEVLSRHIDYAVAKYHDKVKPGLRRLDRIAEQRHAANMGWA